MFSSSYVKETFFGDTTHTPSKALERGLCVVSTALEGPATGLRTVSSEATWLKGSPSKLTNNDLMIVPGFGGPAPTSFLSSGFCGGGVLNSCCLIFLPSFVFGVTTTGLYTTSGLSTAAE